MPTGNKATLAFLIFISVFVTPNLLRAERPNFIVILCDDLGYGDLECYGHPKIKTPNLNRMADQGVRLTSCYSAAPVCSPSRVGLLTGRSPNRAGVYDWIPPAGKRMRPDKRNLVHMRENELTIASLLKRSGYATCMSGKWHCNSQFNSADQPQPGDAGFDHWFGTQNNASPSHANPKNFVRNGVNVGPLEGYSCQLVAEEAIGWMKEHTNANPDQPFFMYVAFHEPHEPVASPADLVERYLGDARSRKEADYFANVENVDIAVGKILSAIKTAGIDDDTFVVFTSDNGPETLNRYKSADRSFGTPGDLRGMKLWTTDAGFRVAGIMRWPGTIDSGRVSDVPVSSLDLLPTFCELAGVELPAGLDLDGMSLGKKPLQSILKRKKPLIWVYYNAINERRVAMRYGNFKMLARLSGKDSNLPKAQNIHSGNREQFLNASLKDFQLFDVTKDIGESEDLFDDSSMESQRLRDLMRTEYERLLKGSHVWE